ncbi:hypothetical protein GCM10010470_37500 [Saccharopolyspora taberi]|uniref:Uncharacterized protein n=1 Tax=Saccharopolyspora taberi TaxID=60895 RepID=A0ABN3VF35_9PSEU
MFVVLAVVVLIAGVAVFEGIEPVAELVDLAGQPADDFGQRTDLLVQILGTSGFLPACCGFTAGARGDLVVAHSGFTSW